MEKNGKGGWRGWLVSQIESCAEGWGVVPSAQDFRLSGKRKRTETWDA